MGGLMHLFDFNQALAGRKLPVNKKLGGGLEAPRNSLDVGGSIPEAPKPNFSRNEEIPYGYELHKASAKKKSTAMSMKSLISQELSTEPQVKNRAPSVVARLMGLDALPNDSKKISSSNVEAKSGHMLPPERQHAEPNSPNNFKLYAKKAKIPDNPAFQSSRPQGGEWEDHKRVEEMLPFRNHPQEKQLQEFKKEFEAWQSHKSGRSSRLVDNFGSQPAAKYALGHEKLHDAKRPLPRERMSSSKLSSPQERLHESKDILDAMDFLQSNKEFFMKFLQESDSSFSRHLQGSEASPQAGKNRQSSRKPDVSEEFRPRSQRDEFVEPRRSFKSEPHYWKGSELDSLVERNVTSASTGPTYGSLGASGLHDQEGLTSSSPARDNRMYAHGQVPTRIVVLKPGRIRNVKDSSPTHSRSAKDFFDAKEVVNEDHLDVLEKLREKLRKDSNGKHKHDRRSAQLNDQYRDLPRDPREVAREIARQVRENVTRELMVEARERSSGRGAQYIRQVVESVDAAGSSETETFGSKKLHLDGYNRSSRPNRDLDLGATLNKEVKRRTSGRLRTLTSEDPDDELTWQDQYAVALKKGEYFEDSRQSSPGSKSSRGSRTSGRHSVDGLNVSHNDRRILYSDRFHPPPDLEAIPPLKNGDGKSPTTLSRSRSASTAASFAYGDRKLQYDKEESPSDDMSAEELEKFVDLTAVAVGTRRNHSVIKGERESLFLTSGELVPRDFCDKSSISSQKEQCQIEDIGPVPDNDSSVSSLEDNLISPEDAYIEEDSISTNTGLQEVPVVEQAGQARKLDDEQLSTVADVEECSQTTLASPHVASCQGSSYSASEASLIINADLIKEQPEHPSPVSVLNVPFQEESEVSVEFKEISSDLQELRIRLRLLRFDDEESEPLPEQDGFEEDGCGVTLENPPSDKSEILADFRFPFSEMDNVDYDMMCPSGKEPEMFYVKAVLFASGFTGDRSVILTQWFAPSQPINPHLFQKIEGHFSCKAPEWEKLWDAEMCKQEGVLDNSSRRLLFDIINDVILEVLGPHVNCRVWSGLHMVSNMHMPCGKDLVQRVWSQVCHLSCLQSEAQDTLENLVAKDLAKGGQWLNVSFDTEAVRFEVERSILNDLLEETLLVL